jgi:hypothetical protein
LERRHVRHSLFVQSVIAQPLLFVVVAGGLWEISQQRAPDVPIYSYTLCNRVNVVPISVRGAAIISFSMTFAWKWRGDFLPFQQIPGKIRDFPYVFPLVVLI